MTKILILSLIALSTSFAAVASETYTCTSTSTSRGSVIPTFVQVNVAANEVSGSLNFNFDSASRKLATFGTRSDNDFALVFANVSGVEKSIVFKQDGYDHFSYTLNFNDTVGTLVQDMQLDCSDASTSKAFMTCTKTVQE